MTNRIRENKKLLVVNSQVKKFYKEAKFSSSPDVADTLSALVEDILTAAADFAESENRRTVKVADVKTAVALYANEIVRFSVAEECEDSGEESESNNDGSADYLDCEKII